jgi:hypothetical protein
MKIFSVVVSVLFGVIVFSGFYLYCYTRPWTNSYMAKELAYIFRDRILKHLILDIIFFIISVFLTTKGRYKTNIALFGYAVVCYTIIYILYNKHA